MNYKNWNSAQNIPVTEKLNFSFYIPKQDEYSEPVIIGRMDKKIIEKSNWNEITDPKWPDGYAKKIMVISYFTVCYYVLSRISGFTVNANQSLSKTVELRFASTKRNTETSTARIETVIGGTSQSGLSGQFTSSYELSSVNEYSNEKSKSETKIETFESFPVDRNVVYYEFSKLIALYREEKNAAECLASNDYHIETKSATYFTKEALNKLKESNF